MSRPTLPRALSLALILGLFAAAIPALSRAQSPAASPRLLFQDDEPALVLRQAESDPLLARVLEQIRRDADAALAAPPLKDVRTGVDSYLRQTARPLVRRVLTLGFLHRLDPDPRFAQRAIADLRAAAALPDWNDRHFLSAAETGFAVAVGLDWFRDDISPGLRERLRAALIEKLIRPGLREHRARSFWVSGHGNWTSVCNASLIAAALAVGDDPEAREMLRLAATDLPFAAGAYGSDGGYDEGPMYWSYGTQFLVLGLDALLTRTDATIAEFETPALRGAGWFPIVMRSHTGRFFNYGDGGEHFALDPAGLWFAHRFHLPGLAHAHRQHFLAEIDAIEAELAGTARRPWYRGSERFRVFEALWLARVGVPDAPPASLPLDFRFSGRPPEPGFKGEAETAVLRGSWHDPDAAFVGIKAGANRGGRAHLDAGTYVFDLNGVRWALQLGGDDYNLPGYFVNMEDRSQRDRPYVYFRKNTRSKNTLLAGDALQSIDAWAPISPINSQPGRARLSIDLTTTYLEYWLSAERTFDLQERRHLLVTDTIKEPAANVAFRSQFLTDAEVELRGAHAILRKGDQLLHARIHSPPHARWELAPATPPSARENQNVGVQILFFSTHGTEGAPLSLSYSLSAEEHFAPVD